MKRAGFKPKYAPRIPREWEGPAPVQAPVRATLGRGDGKARMVVMPKPEKAKPGKRTPTIEERAWMAAITALGCIACRLDGHHGVPGAVHHILRGGRRIGHMHSICLCDPGHHQNGGADKVSRHPWKARFESAYGAEEALLRVSQKLVGGASHGVV